MTETIKQVALMTKKKAPLYYEALQGIAKGLKGEDLDYLMLFSGMEGSGKSNHIKITAFSLSHLLKKDINIRTSWYFSGEEFLNALREIAKEYFELAGIKVDSIEELEALNLRDYIDKVDIKDLDKLKAKYKWHFWILDEAQDLNNKDHMTRFNKSFSKVMMTIRELNMLFFIAYPDITLLDSYIKRFRTKCFNYCFVFPDGARGMTTYARRNYFRIIMDTPKVVQMYSMLGEEFINRYRYDVIEDEMPLFPKDTEEYEAYLKLKRLSLARVVIKETF